MKPRLFASVSLAALGVLAPATGCSITGEAFSGPDGTSVVVNHYGSDAGAGDGSVTEGTSSSGGGADAAATWGNPLCRLAATYGDGGLYGCNPDQPATAIDCAMDGGAAAGDGGGFACRVQPVPPSSSGMNATTTPATGCSPTSGDARVGATCTVSDDCAPGFDCVGVSGNGGASGTCRHYCCAGNSACDDPNAKTFCDVQFLFQASATPVPVCMPIVACDLSKQLESPPTACSLPTQTCAIVREDGTTGCVDIGGSGPGDSCESDHCAAGLTCLGAPGQRTCFQLCTTNSNKASCPQGLTCEGGLPLFQDPTVGVCR